MSTSTVCDQCATPLTVRLLHVEPGMVQTMVDRDLDFCNWSCVARYATEQAGLVLQ